MIFDKLCKIVEKNKKLSSFKETLKNAKLFQIDVGVYDGIAEKICTDEFVDWLKNTFSMPFPIVGVDSQEDLVIFTDTIENQIGIKDSRHFILLIDMYTIDGKSEKYKGFHFIVTGYLENLSFINVDKRYSLDVGISFMGMIPPNNKMIEQDIKKYKHLNYADTFGDSVASSLEILAYCCRPKNFVLETTPKKMKKNAKKIRRSHERPKYTLLKPNQIRKIMGVSTVTNGTGSKKTPHDRRAHTRTLRSERYGDNVGKQIHIPAVWVGASEATVGNKIYKVRLDI